jgi:transposase
MSPEGRPGKPTTRRYTPEEKARAVRLVRQLRQELGTGHGTIQRVASQLGMDRVGAFVGPPGRHR